MPSCGTSLGPSLDICLVCGRLNQVEALAPYWDNTGLDFDRCMRYGSDLDPTD
jgi:hypothetical protein